MSTRLERVAAALKIELFRQWQTYDNGVHMKPDTFAAIDFQALATKAQEELDADWPHAEEGRDIEPTTHQVQ